MKTQQTPDNSKRHITATKDKIYWRDLPADSQVTEAENAYYCEGKLVYWHGHEVQSASLWLNTHLAATATPVQASGNCQASHSPFICPICKTEQPAHHTCSFPRVETGEGMKGVSWKDYWTLQAHAQRLAAFAKSVAELDLAAVDCGMIPTDTWKRIHAQAREALAQWEKESTADADALEALDQLEQLEGGE